MTEFHATVRTRGSAAVIELHGDVSGDADVALRSAYQQALADQPARVLLKFDDVEYMNATGIALIVGLLAEARKAGLPVLVCGLIEHFRHIFEVTRLADLTSFFPDEEAAVGGPAAPAS